MKKLILIALAFVSLQVVAQDKQKVDKKDKAEQMKDMSAKDQATIASKKLTLVLDLNEKQQSQVKELMLEQATRRKEKMAQKAELKVNNQAKSKAKTSQVERINERLDHKIDMKQKMKAILTAEQYTKWEGMQGRRDGKGKKKQKMKSKN